ncbi:OmpA family protein [Wenzhouxiangella marina]|uniref:Inner membrane lipoprotein YiaD n=1 Tax=Wenzhouxiangella marina TaxID=1579979 RepID=A0A0K0XUZ9_9GAMM|nr:OmpA family protein [Wenzhouxiangella marina]AKS41446.1 Inner membrane lipoprotein YiaD [Wenzhouxiangella marina]MBB6086799.1 outer membrane protein OmpA-like peptidoglycan-associated protein [Wenzhouxiangella marina]
MHPIHSTVAKLGLGLMLLVGLFAGPLVAQTRSLAEIEAELDPLEFVENHGGVRRSIDLSIEFAFNSAALLPEGQRQVDILGRAFNGDRLRPYRFRIIGHTDAVGSAEYNQALSERRAQAVRAALIEGHGIDPDRLVAEGAGEAELIDGLAEDAREHRRVEISVLDDTTDEADSDEVSTEGEVSIEWD